VSVPSLLRNLQAAVGAYYDFYGPVTVPTISVEDVNLKAGETVPPNMPLIKTWRVKNSGGPGDRQAGHWPLVLE